MKKILAAAIAAVATAVLLQGCGRSETQTIELAKYKVGVPNDTTNEARALLLLQQLGYIRLDESKGIQVTKLDIVDSGKVEIYEIEAAQLPNTLPDVAFAIINSNFAISSGLNPVKDSLAIEGSFSAYANIVAVKEGAEKTDKIKALVAALSSAKVKDYILEKYNGSVVAVVENPGDGYDASVNYDALAGTTVSVAASPTPHAEILQIAKAILAEKKIDLKIIEFTDYVQPNNVVESGEIDANYFQHYPYLADFNKENGTHIVNAAAIHVEPMGIYGGREKSLDVLKK